MTLRAVLATEGPASQAVLRSLCLRLGVRALVLRADGKDRLLKDFHRLFATSREHSESYIVVPDLHPNNDCRAEVERWRREIDSRFPLAKLSLAIWETESWLLADAAGLSRDLGIPVVGFDPESVIGSPPSDVLHDLFRKSKGYRRGAAFDKETDGARLISIIDLQVARERSPSLGRLLRLLGH